MTYRSGFQPMVRLAPLRGLNEVVDYTDARLAQDFTPDCRNVVFKNAAIRPRDGYKKINSSAITDAPVIEGIHDYSNTSGEKQMLVQGNGSIYQRVGDAFSLIKQSTISGERYSFTNALDKCVVMRGFQQEPVVWDGQIARENSIIPRAKFVFFYNEHVFVCSLEGFGANASMVRVSGQRDLNQFDTGDVLNIQTNDGENISGVSKIGRNIAFWKDTSRTEWYGTFWDQSSGNFDAAEIGNIQGVGCLSHWCLITVNGITYTLDRQGIWALAPGSPARLITANVPRFWKLVNLNISSYFSVAHNPDDRWIVWSVAVFGAGDPNALIVYDYDNNAIWPMIMAGPIKGLSTVRDPSNRMRMYFGDKSGFVYELFNGVVKDDSAAVQPYIVWPGFGNDSPGQEKMFDELMFHGDSTGTHENTVETDVDGLLGDRRLVCSYVNSEGQEDQEQRFTLPVSISHTGRVLRTKIIGSGNPWSLYRVEARGRMS